MSNSDTGTRPSFLVNGTPVDGHDPGVIALQPGDTVEITVTGKVGPAGGSRHICNGTVLEIHDPQSGRILAYADPNAATARRLEPEGYPPQQGDLWRDKAGELWFCARRAATTGAMGTSLEMVPAFSSDPLQHWGTACTRTMTLVHRAAESTQS